MRPFIRPTAPVAWRASLRPPSYAPLPGKQAREIRSVSRAPLRSIGSGKRHPGRNLPPGLAKAGKLTRYGKPELAYIIGEFCPFCAGESWSVAIALSSFEPFTA